MDAGDVISAVVQLGIAIAGSAFVVQLLTLRQSRRKIAGDASTAEANAASTLSGAALKMVEAAQSDTQAAKREFTEHKAECEAERKRMRRELDLAHDRIDMLERRERDLEDVLRTRGIPIPPRRRGYDQRPTRK